MKVCFYYIKPFHLYNYTLEKADFYFFLQESQYAVAKKVSVQ